MQQHGCESILLVGVSHDESHLSHSAVVEPVVAADRNELSGALDDEGQPGFTVLGEMCDFAGPQIPVWIEVPLPNGLRGKVVVEPQQGSRVG